MKNICMDPDKSALLSTWQLGHSLTYHVFQDSKIPAQHLGQGPEKYPFPLKVKNAFYRPNVRQCVL